MALLEYGLGGPLTGDGKMKKTIEGYRITLEVDKEWFAAIAEMTSYAEYGELMHWVSTDDIKVDVEVCDICNIMAAEDGYIDHDEYLHEDEE